MKKHSTTAAKLGLHKEVISYLGGGNPAIDAVANLVTTTSSTPLCTMFTDQM